jgi:Zn finger protein HypA/HybF involved in hydrogenase expression
MANPPAWTYFYPMHEYGVALEIVAAAMAAASGRHVSKATVRVGGLSGVCGESLAMYCDLVFREKQPRAVDVVLITVPARFRCACGADYSPPRVFEPCPSCGGGDRSVIDGKECSLESIEVNDA